MLHKPTVKSQTGNGTKRQGEVTLHQTSGGGNSAPNVRGR